MNIDKSLATDYIQAKEEYDQALSIYRQKSSELFDAQIAFARAEKQLSRKEKTYRGINRAYNQQITQEKYYHDYLQMVNRVYKQNQDAENKQEQDEL